MRIRPVAALPLLLLLLGCPGADEAPEVDFRVSVTVEEAARGDVEMTLITTGSVRAGREAELTTPGAGQLRLLRNPGTGRRYRDGDTVRAGEILAVVETEETRVSRTSGIEAIARTL